MSSAIFVDLTLTFRPYVLWWEPFPKYFFDTIIFKIIFVSVVLLSIRNVPLLSLLRCEPRGMSMPLEYCPHCHCCQACDTFVYAGAVSLTGRPSELVM